MINLKNVSKFYYKNGIIASGITKVNLKLSLGEFVVVTGESGSGKSTLLNVISGLDTYEEGEMYIDGKETSHFMDREFAEYRKKYIGNIFQNFNLVNSYTVYQNIELILLINGYPRAEIRKRTNDIISRVGLSEYARTKASKLSGGQRQRVAIARALAKDTGIIVADEPTGNLDSESAGEIVRLLAEIASEKLVIVVTHNYDQFEAYATRKIKMHDGRIAEDAILRPAAANEAGIAQRTKKTVNSGRLKNISKLRLGIRNAFNVFPKFVLLLVVFIFMLTAVTSQYTSYLSQKEEADALGYNSYFNNLSLERMILKKNDGGRFTGTDYENIRNVDNVSGIAEYDVLFDTTIYMEKGDFYIEAYPRMWDEFEGRLIKGRMPEADDEVILTGYKDDEYFGKKYLDKITDKNFKVSLGSLGRSFKFKVVGIAYKHDDQKNMASYGDIYMSDKLLDSIIEERYHENSKLLVEINGREQVVDPYDTAYNLYPNSKAPEGGAIVSEELDGYFKDGRAYGKNLSAKVSNIYYKSSKTFKIHKTYNNKNFRYITGRNDYDFYGGVIFINPADYRSLYTSDNYQATVFVSDKQKIDETKASLDKMGYDVLALKDVIIRSLPEFMNMITLPITIIVIVALFFISYFVIRLILKSRQGYFSILRMLGMSRKNIRRIVDVELIAMASIAFAIFAAVAGLSLNGYVSIRFFDNLIKYMKPSDYGILYAILVVMSYLISGKFSRSLFKKSAMSTYREE